MSKHTACHGHQALWLFKYLTTATENAYGITVKTVNAEKCEESERVESYVVVGMAER